MNESSYKKTIYLFQGQIPAGTKLTYTPETGSATILYNDKFFRTEYFYYEFVIALKDLVYLDKILKDGKWKEKSLNRWWGKFPLRKWLWK
jgi:hypothetical protein